mmetsp:Transcript_120531/g.257367  ORF Transcript_120531/g.257367 Transcript_120531/m.257367 type:complete len:364 (+) Transcript_120531:4291-5382(+)
MDAQERHPVLAVKHLHHVVLPHAERFLVQALWDDLLGRVGQRGQLGGRIERLWRDEARHGLQHVAGFSGEELIPLLLILGQQGQFLRLRIFLLWHVLARFFEGLPSLFLLSVLVPQLSQSPCGHEVAVHFQDHQPPGHHVRQGVWHQGRQDRRWRRLLLDWLLALGALRTLWGLLGLGGRRRCVSLHLGRSLLCRGLAICRGLALYCGLAALALLRRGFRWLGLGLQRGQFHLVLQDLSQANFFGSRQLPHHVGKLGHGLGIAGPHGRKVQDVAVGLATGRAHELQRQLQRIASLHRHSALQLLHAARCQLGALLRWRLHCELQEVRRLQPLEPKPLCQATADLGLVLEGAIALTEDPECHGR